MNTEQNNAHEELLAELAWCIGNGNTGPRSLAALEKALAVLAAAPSPVAQPQQICHDCDVSPNGTHQIECPEYAATLDAAASPVAQPQTEWLLRSYVADLIHASEMCINLSESISTADRLIAQNRIARIRDILSSDAARAATPAQDKQEPWAFAIMRNGKVQCIERTKWQADLWVNAEAVSLVPAGSQQEAVDAAAMIDWLADEEAQIEKLTLQNGTRYRICWPKLDEEQIEWFATPREAIDAARADTQAQKGGAA